MILDELVKSYQKGQKRNPVADCKKFLKTRNIKYKLRFSNRFPRSFGRGSLFLAQDSHASQLESRGFFARNKILKSTPTLIPVNHYCRNIFQRKTPFTTLDSIIVASLVTVGLSKLTTRKTSWVVQDNLDKTFPYKLTNIRKIQLAAIYCYDLIGESQNYPFSNIKEWENKLKNGLNIAFFPEGSPSRKLKPINSDFDKHLLKLREKIPSLQILPTSVFYAKNTFFVIFHKDFQINSHHHEMAKYIMTKITQNLPENLRGKYFSQPTLPQQLPVGDQRS